MWIIYECYKLDKSNYSITVVISFLEMSFFCSRTSPIGVKRKEIKPVTGIEKNPPHSNINWDRFKRSYYTTISGPVGFAITDYVLSYAINICHKISINIDLWVTFTGLSSHSLSYSVLYQPLHPTNVLCVSTQHFSILAGSVGYLSMSRVWLLLSQQEQSAVV